MHSLNASYSFYYYLMHIASQNNPPTNISVFSCPPRFHLLLLINQKPILASKKKNTSLSLKVQFNHWPFPRDLPWQSRSRGISSSPVSFTWPLSHSASSLHFLGWRNMRTWTRVSHLSNEDYNPLPPFCWMRYFKLPITCLINHSTCIHSHVASHVCLNIL